jgi:metallo-beta-lactamase class B
VDVADLRRRGFLACACCAPLGVRTAYGAALAGDGSPQALELGVPAMTRLAATVWVARLSPGLWLHCTTGRIDPGIYYPANGLILERPHGALLIDTGWLPDHALTLLDWSRNALSAPITEAVATHFHSDRTGGVAALHRAGVPTYAHPLTCSLAAAHRLNVPVPCTAFGNEPYTMGAGCELFRPGAGHTPDNVVAWFPAQRVLYGGCFLKSVTSGGLGNVADAVLADWPASVQRARRAYPGAIAVVPGHGTISGDPMAHTLKLLAA